RVPSRANRKRKLRRGVVVRGLVNRDDVVLPHRDVPRLELDTELLHASLVLLHPIRNVLDRLCALLRQLEQRDVVRHVTPSFTARKVPRRRWICSYVNSSCDCRPSGALGCFRNFAMCCSPQEISAARKLLRRPSELVSDQAYERFVLLRLWGCPSLL